MKKILSVLLLTTAPLLSGCDDESRFSIYRANFIFDKSIQPFIQANSYGQFLCVKQKTAGQYEVTDATGSKKTYNIPEMQMQMSPFHYGLGGLIIGTPMNCDGNIWAYDWACPTCDSQRYRVEIDRAIGHATCPKCATKFDLNSGGIAIEGKSRPLLLYRVIDTGTDVLIQN